VGCNYNYTAVVSLFIADKGPCVVGCNYN